MSEPDKSPSEDAAAMLGRNPAEVAALDRFFAVCVTAQVKQSMLAFECRQLTGAIRGFVEAIQECEAREVAAHPDLAELNVMLDGDYEH